MGKLWFMPHLHELKSTQQQSQSLGKTEHTILVFLTWKQAQNMKRLAQATLKAKFLSTHCTDRLPFQRKTLKPIPTVLSETEGLAFHGRDMTGPSRGCLTEAGHETAVGPAR